MNRMISVSSRVRKTPNTAMFTCVLHSARGIERKAWWPRPEGRALIGQEDLPSPSHVALRSHGKTCPEANAEENDWGDPVLTWAFTSRRRFTAGEQGLPARGL